MGQEAFINGYFIREMYQFWSSKIKKKMDPIVAWAGEDRSIYVLSIHF